MAHHEMLNHQAYLLLGANLSQAKLTSSRPPGPSGGGADD